MYTVFHSKQFTKAFRVLVKQGLTEMKQRELASCIDILSDGEKLSAKHSDHSLTGDFEGYREFHIGGDLLVIYQIQEKRLVLVLVDIGSHAKLFG